MIFAKIIMLFKYPIVINVKFSFLYCNFSDGNETNVIFLGKKPPYHQNILPLRSFRDFVLGSSFSLFMFKIFESSYKLKSSRIKLFLAIEDVTSVRQKISSRSKVVILLYSLLITLICKFVMKKS